MDAFKYIGYILPYSRTFPKIYLIIIERLVKLRQPKKGEGSMEVWLCQKNKYAKKDEFIGWVLIYFINS